MTTEASKMLITFLLDRSSSMLSIRPATLEAFNGYVDQLKADYERDGGIPIEMTLLQFDFVSGMQIDKTFFQKPLSEIPELTTANHVPRGSTPLIDAALATIEALEKAVDQMTDMPKIVVCIQTDGEENTSKHPWSELKEKIAEKIAAGWQFNFMGAGIDAYQQGAKMGFSAGQTMSYDSSDLGATRAAFAASATNAGGFRTGAMLDTSYSTMQKMAAGDAYDPEANAGKKPYVKPTISRLPSAQSVTGWASPSAVVGSTVPLDLTQPLDQTRPAPAKKAEEKGLDLTSE